MLSSNSSSSEDEHDDVMEEVDSDEGVTSEDEETEGEEGVELEVDRVKSCVPHQHSSPLEVEGKKAGASTTGRSCTLSIYHSHLMVRRRCLVGEKTFTSSRLS